MKRLKDCGWENKNREVSLITLAQNGGYRYICSSVPKLHQQTSVETLIHRFAVTADMTLDSFTALLQGRGLNAIRLRHALLATTKAILGNDLYTRLRSVWIK
jgi:hypothetical protein